MRLKLIACEILYRELCAAVSRSINEVDIEFLPKGLHDIGQSGMSARLAEALAAVDESRYEAVLFGYGLCSNGLVGLTARNVPLVLPLAHDCITLFLGGKERYLEYFHAHPGVYFKTSGWIERGETLHQSIQQQTGMMQTYEEFWPSTAKTMRNFFGNSLATGRTTTAGWPTSRWGSSRTTVLNAKPGSKRPSGAGNSRRWPAT